MTTYDQRNQHVETQANIAGDRTEVAIGTVEGDISQSVIVGRDANNIHIGDRYELVERPPLFVGVPSMPQYFVGREEQVEKLVNQLISDNTLALSAEGLPGVGKTTLAIALAYRKEVREYFKDGVLWAGLGIEPDVMSQLARWATALEIDVSELVSEEERSAAIHDAIGQRHLLLVIDDVWDTKEVKGIDLADLLRCGGPNCCHILTTRNQAIARAFAGANQVEQVPVLEEAAAYQLLESLAPEAYVATPDASQRLVETVGKLPLAIELLGGYLAVPERSYFPDLSQEALAEMTDPKRRLQLAQKRLGDRKGQQVTLQETIYLSLEGLPEQVVHTFHALGAFAAKPERFERAAATAVTGAEARTLALLISRNLVEIDVEGWLALHQTIVDVARIKIPSEMIAAHRTYYLELVNENREDWQRIESVYGQIKWAWQAAPGDNQLSDFQESVNTYQDRRGLWNDKIDWLERILDIAKREGWQAEMGRLLNNIGSVYSDLGEKQKAFDFYNQALLIVQQVGDRTGERLTCCNIAVIYISTGELDKAEEQMHQVIALEEAIGHPDLERDKQVLVGIQALRQK